MGVCARSRNQIELRMGFCARFGAGSCPKCLVEGGVSQNFFYEGRASRRPGGTGLAMPQTRLVLALVWSCVMDSAWWVPDCGKLLPASPAVLVRVDFGS